MEGDMFSRAWTRRVQGKTRLSQMLRLVTKFKPHNVLAKMVAQLTHARPKQSAVCV